MLLNILLNGTDDRSSITIKNILDMRSGLVPICYNPATQSLGECLTAADSSSGGNIVYADDQMTKCINRNLASDGYYPWYGNGSSLYIRCISIFKLRYDGSRRDTL